MFVSLATVENASRTIRRPAGRRLPAQPGSSNKWVARGTISSRQIDDLEPTLTRHGYEVRTLADQFNVKPIEFKQDAT
jgi:hypothetical protein